MIARFLLGRRALLEKACLRTGQKGRNVTGLFGGKSCEVFVLMDRLKAVYLGSNTEFFTALIYTNSFALTV